MANEDKIRESINLLAKKYREQSRNKISHEDARKRIIKAITKKEQ
tara:strand:+ start:197 stop:331 length:135 start_codon:yes stop_codon:yes gene_type:complete